MRSLAGSSALRVVARAHARAVAEVRGLARAEEAMWAAGAAEVEDLGDGRKTIHFERTPPLSTYLIALAVGDLEASRTTRAGWSSSPATGGRW